MLQLTDIRKSYHTSNFKQTALDGVTIAFRDNEFAAVLGPSGSGKTTMLNIIGGLDHYDYGDLDIDGISTKKYQSHDWDTYRNSRIGFVFQSYNLIPHQSVLSNVEIALTLSGVPIDERRTLAEKALEEVGLGDHIKKLPSQLSGGQMQRVAIARALINDPDILLADEPTGALDTQTSKQVMDLLTRIAKDRLVIMVTHNNELAEHYANRIIHLSDGQIASDSRPFDPANEKQRTGRKANKARMSFFTAIALSFSNLMTKKGRTFVTSLAGSIGIIGIAAILALANGINTYIKNVERETLSVYPLTIQNSSFDLTSMFTVFGETAQEESVGEGSSSVKERKLVGTMFSSRNKNDLASLKAYFDNNKGVINPYANTIQYLHDITPQIYLADTSSGADQVNPDSILGSLDANGGMSSLMGGSGGMPGVNVFHEMPGDRKMFEYQYHVVAGHWAEKYDEAILVLSSDGSVSDLQLYAMGLRDRLELKEMMEALMNETETDLEIDKEGGTYAYDTLMSTGFKVVSPATRYQYEDKYSLWVDKSADKTYMKSLVEAGLSLQIVGIVQPNPDATATSLSSGINYTPDLIRYLMDEAASRKVVQDQLARPTVNVLTGKTFVQENQESANSAFNFTNLITIDESAIRNAVTIDSSKLNIDPSALGDFSLDISDFELPAIELPDFSLTDAVNIEDITSAIVGQVNIAPEQITAIMSSVLRDFLLDESGKGVTDPNQISTDLTVYLARTDVKAVIEGQVAQLVAPTQIQSQVSDALQTYIQTAIQTHMTQVMWPIETQIQTQLQTQIEKAMQKAMAQLPTQMQNAVRIDQDAFAQALKLNTGESEILNVMTSLMNPEESTYERNLSILGYADPKVPSQINIYPLNFESKQEIQNILDRYNEQLEADGELDKVVHYTDFVGTIMSSVTDIVNMVSYALIAFVAISLVVSSLMIGVITYISVLERKKEIGILRAIGASKRDVRRVFNAETLIVGFVAGVLGIFVTHLICILANIIILNEFGIEQIAQLPMAAAIILIAVSMFLAFIAGLFPSSAAARKDPVEALRSE